MLCLIKKLCIKEKPKRPIISEKVSLKAVRKKKKYIAPRAMQCSRMVILNFLIIVSRFFRLV
jgi:hypothetical protein